MKSYSGELVAGDGSLNLLVEAANKIKKKLDGFLQNLTNDPEMTESLRTLTRAGLTVATLDAIEWVLIDLEVSLRESNDFRKDATEWAGSIEQRVRNRCKDFKEYKK